MGMEELSLYFLIPLINKNFIIYQKMQQKEILKIIYLLNYMYEYYLYKQKQNKHFLKFSEYIKMNVDEPRLIIIGNNNKKAVYFGSIQVIDEE